MAFSTSEYMKLRQQRLSGVAEQSGPQADAAAPADDFASSYMALRQKRIAAQGQEVVNQHYQSQIDSYNQSLQGVLDGYDKTAHAADAQAGWADYTATQKRIAQNEEDSENNQTWFDKLIGYLGNSQDTSLPIHMTGEVTKGVQEQDEKLSRPTDEWSEDQRLTFGYLWNTSRQKAWQYARMVNTERNRQAELAKMQQIQNYATKNFGSGLGHTVGSVLSAPLGLADTMGDMIEMGTLGHLSETDGEITPYEYSDAVKGGVAQHLNEKGGTLDEDIPIIGGKGWGDVYGLGTSIAQSILSAHTGGAGQALITSFGPAVQSGINSAKSRGATDKQAMSFGLMSGLAEALAEQIGVDSLMKIGSADTMKDLALNILKQGATEGLEEGITSLATSFADQLVMANKSEFNLAALMYMSNGMSKAEAEKQAWLDMAEGVLFDMFAGFASGGISGGLETGVKTGVKSLQTALNKIDDIYLYQPEDAPREDFSANQTVPDFINLMDDSAAGSHTAPSAPLSTVAGSPTATNTAKDAVTQPAQQRPGETIGSNNTSGIKNQIRGSQGALNAMQPVADIRTPANYSQMDIASKKNWVVEKLRSTGYKVERKGFGIIDFAKKRLKSAFNYFDKGGAEEAAFEAIPYVLEHGIEVSSRDQHKDREYGTITIAAPVTINGKRGNMAVVVKQTTGNYYKVHRILTPDGSVFVLPEIANEAESTPAGEAPETGSLATPKDSASGNSISQPAQNVNPIDTALNTVYDNKNTTGGTTYAQTGTDSAHGTRPLGANNEFAGVQAESRGASFEDIRQRSLYTDENETVRTRLSAALAGELERRGYRHGNADGLHLTSGRGQTFEMLTVDASTFHDIFEVARKYTRNGELVDLHSVEATEDGIGYEACENYLSADGMSGFAITPVGDLISVFNADASKKGFLRAIAPVVKSKVKTLDCYMSQQQPLHEIYEKAFGMKVASVMDHNMDYDHDGIAANHNSPKVAFMVNSDRAVEPAFFGKDDYDAAKAYRDNLIDQGGKTQNAEASPSTESVGAAPADFSGKSAYYDLLYEGNVQPDRPGDVRPMEVPKTDPYGRRVSETAANLYGAEITPDETADQIQELITIGALGFDTKTNKQMLSEAADAIKKDGLSASERKVNEAVFKGKAKDSDIAKAMLLYNAYANRKGEAAQAKAAELMVDLATMANDAGRRLQLFSLIRKMTPHGQLMTVQNGVQRSVDRINSKRSRRNQAEVTIPQELADEYLEAARRDLQEQTEDSAAAKEAVEEAIHKAAAAQIDASPMEKLNAWRYMAMLGNAKTQIRNIAGNAAFRPMASVKRAVGAVIEQAFVEQENRTKSILGVGQDARALLDWAKEDAKGQAAQQLLSYSGLTGDSARDAIQEERQIFDTAWLETVRKTVQAVPEHFDMIFKSREYTYSLASFVKARGYSSADLTSNRVPEDVLDAARTYAAQEALKATFNDHNTVSDFLSRRFKGNNSFEKAANMLVEGIMPFRRTPANILVRGIEYSPANVARSVWNLSTKVRSGEMSAATAIDQMASGLTGTAAMVLGYALASGIFGIRLRGKIEDEDEKRMGHQQYAIEIGDRSYTVDWLAPVNIPLFVGANCYESGQKESVDWFSAAVDSAGSAFEPMLELSCLSSLNDIFQSAKYAEEGTELWSAVASAATSYVTQFIPTLFGQVEQATESEKQIAYSDADTSVGRSIEKTIGRMTQRIPGVDLFQAKKYDAWGNEVETSTAFQSFFNPSYTGDISNDPIDAEIARLNKAQGANVSPSLPSQTISYLLGDGKTREKRRLTSDEYETLCRVQGQNQRRLVEEIINSDDYAALSGEEKAQAIRFAYDYATMISKSAVVDYHEEPAYIENRPDGMSEAEAIIRHVAVGTTEKYADLPISAAAYVDDLLKGLQPETEGGSVRPIQKMEAVVSDDKLTAYVDGLLRDIMPDSTEAKYDKAISKGFTAEQFVEGYRQYSDATGEGKKQAVIRYCQHEMGMSYAAAQKLYEIYNSKATDE